MTNDQGRSSLFLEEMNPKVFFSLILTYTSSHSHAYIQCTHTHTHTHTDKRVTIPLGYFIMLLAIWSKMG